MFKLIKFIYKIIKWPVIILVLLGLLAWFNPEKYLTIDSGPVTADVLIVVGGSAHDRAERAAQLFRQHAAPRILITGQGDDWNNREILLANGVPARAIQVENKSTNTRENAQFSGKILNAEKIRSAIVVTSWYHARRAEKAFEHFSPGIRFYSRPSYFGFDRADWQKSGINRRMRLEFLKLPGYWIRYGINPF